MLTYHAARGSQPDLHNVRIAAAIPMFVILGAAVNSGIAHLTPHLYDSVLLRLDFGVSSTLYHWALEHPSRFILVDNIYCALPLEAAIVIAYTTRQARTHLLWAVCLAALLVIPCYFLMPAVGAAHIHQPFAPRNCMPSLHFTWAALLWLNTQPVWLRRCAFGFMLLTAFATLASGEHYVLDLAAAVPYTWMVQELSKPVVR